MATTMTRDEIAERYAVALAEGRAGVSPVPADYHYKFADAILTKDVYLLSNLANGLNEVGKKIFSEATGVKLPKQQGETWTAIREWGDISEELDNKNNAWGRVVFERKQFEPKHGVDALMWANEKVESGFNELKKINRETWLVNGNGQGFNLSKKGTHQTLLVPYLEAKIKYEKARIRCEQLDGKVEVRNTDEKNYYYVSGTLGMKSDGSFTGEKRYWMTFTRETAIPLQEGNQQPYGATKRGVFLGTISGERLKMEKPVTPQVPVGDMEKYIKVAADSIAQLRKADVYRVLVESNRVELRQGIAGYIKEMRPDLADEVDGVLEEAKEQKSIGAKGAEGCVTKGVFSGVVLSVTDNVVVQKVNRDGGTAIHDASNLSAHVNKGDLIDIKYRDGVGEIGGKLKQGELEL